MANSAKNSGATSPSNPPDLLFEQFVYATPRTPGPPSNAMQVFDEKAAYKSIRGDYSQFLLLCQIIKQNPHYGPLVETLEISTSTTGNTSDFKAEDEELVYHFFKSATSLKKIFRVECPRLQLRMFSSKYTTTCYKSLDLLRLHYPEDDSNIALIRYLSYIPVIRDLRVLIFAVKGGVFDEREKKKFKKMDSVAFKRAGKAPINTTLTLIEFMGTRLPTGLTSLVKTSPQLSMFYLAIESYFLPAKLLAAFLNPSALAVLSITPIGHHGATIVHDDIKRFIKLSDLLIPGHSIDADVIAGLAEFKHLGRLDLVGDTPGYENLRLLLMRTSLQHLDLRVPATIQVNERIWTFDKGYNEAGGRRGTLRWHDSWTGPKFQSILKLAQEKGIEIEDVAKWHAAIAMSASVGGHRALGV